MQEAMMFTPLLLAAAIGAASPSDYQVIVVDDQPTISIPLQRLNLGREEDMRRAKRRVAYGATLVCERAYRGVSYLETVECVKAAMADGDAQLNRIGARESGSASVAAAVAITAR
jgi:UrcA family protein